MTSIEDKPTVRVDLAGVGKTGKSSRKPGQSKLKAALHPKVWSPLAVMLVVLGFVWERTAETMPYLLPHLNKVGAALTKDPAKFFDNAWWTLQEAMVGLLIGFTAAFVLAVLTSEWGVARRAVMPIAVVLNVTPLVAIAPVLVVAFGFGPEPKLIVTALICFFTLLINISTGLRSVPPAVLQVYQTVRASRWEMLWRIRIPNALPYIFAGLRIAFPLSIVGAVVAEMSAPGASLGLGTIISISSSMNRLDMVFASITILAVMGSLLLLVVTTVERKVLHWHESTKQGAK
ncbi:MULTISPECIES: ABC transporter permease [Actinosynnema]|uniref:Binding-protein-dependent transport systems inner membrane component n=4 Tax=Actinosynnema TaxID=40566 RepID=C6WMN3_ACTMD|nr:ABC transporter permease [Actinosynnema mirum]ACU36562.1 binding-protein-dependent transport systems inner membrane component [Actinosynnema mirum DSM 43827]ATE54149.1 ABC transporter permease [Actinosynnema pretiosum]AXX30016.1 Hydroxymethylpyrimidine ABC transporter, transmembrane component [Actinosynnema pretiosum subsp. pretiosum]MCP2092366.1 NitT/TauT family transport system permease protein [Actinosynnema pretiosum]